MRSGKMNRKSPYFSIWLRPWETVQRILDDDPNHGVITIAIIVGVTAALRTSVLHGLHPLPDLVGLTPLLDDIIRVGIGGNRADPIMTAAAVFVFGSLMGVGLVFLGGILLRLGGLLGGGRGHYEQIRSAVAWSFVPYMAMFPAWFLFAVLNAGRLRAVSWGNAPIHMTAFGWDLTLLFLVDLAVRLTCIVFLIINIARIHRIRPVLSVALVLLAFVPITFILIPSQGFSF